MAELAERSGSPRAIYWRQRLTELEPGDLSNRAALVRAAVRFGQAGLAQETLDAFRNAGGDGSALYHEASAELAFSAGSLHSAQEHLAKAAALSGTDCAPTINLQIVRLHSTDSEVVRRAREKLEAMQSDPVFGAGVLRALTGEAASQGDLDRALRFSLRLLVRSEACFEDRLAHLEILDALETRRMEGSEPPLPDLSDAKESGQSLAVGHPPPTRGVACGPALERTQPVSFEACLGRLEAEAVQTGRTAELLTWLADHGRAKAGIALAAALPGSVRSSLPVRRAEIGCYGAAQDWAALTDWLNATQWGPDECLRHAFLALAFRRQHREAMARAEWDRAVRAGMPSGVPLLVQLAGEWRWESEAEALLWATAREADGWQAGWALTLLGRAYELRGDTRSLLRVFTMRLGRDPGDLVAKNNVAAASLLLGTNLPWAHRLAREVYEKDPSRAAFACTHAFSLHLLGRTKEGLALLSKLPEEARRNPSTAAYYGLMLRACGESAAARECVPLAESGRLLPEERAFLSRVEGCP
ncbi:MAG: hypothetical protein AB9869_27695 [Verrucomicrobiia bacterium]